MSSKRRRPSSTQSGSSQPSAPAAPPPISPPRPALHEKDRIGDILRRVREHRGEDLEEISDYLRIRPSFLYALENSRYSEIPADAYVIGFLRTYALYLGLDGKGAVDQYRREMAGRRRAPQLSMPQPMSEGRIPTLAILISATVVCLLIYGLWYGLSTPDRSIIADPVPLPLPAAEETRPESNPASEALAAMPAGDLLLQTTTGASEALSSLATVNETAKPPEKSVEEAAPPPPPETTEKPIEERPERFGASSPVPLVIRAEKDSWILITDNKGVTVFERTLKPGETYHVPQTPGLRLTTGHAGGLILMLNDKILPKLSVKRQVARGIELDPEKLKATLSNPTKAEEE